MAGVNVGDYVMKKDCNGPMALRGHPCHRSLAHDHAPDYTSAMTHHGPEQPRM